MMRGTALLRTLGLLGAALCSCSGGDDDAGEGGRAAAGSAAQASGSSGMGGGSAGSASSSAGSTSSSAGGASSSAGTGSDGGGVCAALGDVCMDDHPGPQGSTARDCCEGGFCGSPVCTDAIPPHCMATCTCPGDGQTCREERKGEVTTERPCCDGFSCSGCIDVDPDSRLCVCRPG